VIRSPSDFAPRQHDKRIALEQVRGSKRLTTSEIDGLRQNKRALAEKARPLFRPEAIARKPEQNPARTKPLEAPVDVLI
jgi:hypothetical protein